MIPYTSYTLLIAQIIAHLSIIPMIMYATPTQWAIAVFVYFVNTCLGMTMTYHRLLSHRSWDCPQWLERFFALCAGIGMTGSAISWVAIHRDHHKHSDTEKDPHAPAYKGWLWCQWGTMFAKVNPRLVVDLMRDKFYSFQHKWYWELAIAYGVICYLIDPFAVVYAWLVPAMMCWSGGSIIVSTSHRTGGPHNDLSLAFLVWGEGYHKNHHDNWRAKRFGTYDLGGFLIERIEKLYKA